MLWTNVARVLFVSKQKRKGMADNDQRREFLAEIKLMKDMGSHNNIVNVLGCRAVEETVLLLVEYIPYGDLLHYLRRRRTKITENNRIYVERKPRKADNEHSSEAAKETGIDNKGMTKEDEANDEKDESKETLSPEDLIAFAWQISRGMEYLTTKGFVHGDLAARNVLVGENKIAKVADFGLTRHVKKEKVHHSKRIRELQTFKWMSIEAISDQKFEFTTQSDVWAFGVLLWELLTLGGTPYPTIDNRDELLRLLKGGGHRMEKPDICNEEMFSMMTDCWMEHPDDRPNFTQIRERLEGMMPKDKTIAKSDELLKSGNDDNSLGGLERKTSKELHKDETGPLSSSKEGPEMDKGDGPVGVNKIDFNNSLRDEDFRDRKNRDKNIKALEMA